MQMPETHDRRSPGVGAFDLDVLVALSPLCAFALIGVKGSAGGLRVPGTLAAARAGDATRRAVGAMS